MTAFELTSAAFEQGRPIPAKYFCDGDDLNPSLAWRRPLGVAELIGTYAR